MAISAKFGWAPPVFHPFNCTTILTYSSIYMIASFWYFSLFWQQDEDLLKHCCNVPRYSLLQNTAPGLYLNCCLTIAMYEIMNILLRLYWYHCICITYINSFIYKLYWSKLLEKCKVCTLLGFLACNCVSLKAKCHSNVFIYIIIWQGNYNGSHLRTTIYN